MSDLKDFAEAVNSGRRVFLSYKRDDFEGATGVTTQGEGASSPQQVGELLEREGFSCWWDHWHIPALESERRFDEDLLNNILDDAVRQSCWFVALMTDGFCSKPSEENTVWWTRKEWDRAGAERDRETRSWAIRRVAVFFGDTGRDRRQRALWLTDEQDLWCQVGSDPEPRDVARKITRMIGGADF